MKSRLLAALLAAPAAALAGAAADPAAPARAPAYRSVFDGARTGVEEQTVDGREANDAVAQFPRGHIDLLKWEQAQDREGAARPAPAPAAGDPHEGHR